MEIKIKRIFLAEVDLLLAVPEGLFDAPITRPLATAFLSDPANSLFLAFEGDLAVGMASGTDLRHPDKPASMFIQEVGVRDAHQRRGIGKAVTQALIDAAHTRGVTEIWLGTEPDNTAARALYRALAGDEVPGVYFGWGGALDP